MKKLFILILLLWGTNTYADEPRITTSFTSSNGRFQFRITNKLDSINTYDLPIMSRIYKWTLVDRTTNTELYSIEGRFALKTALISDDGQYIVIVDDACLHKTKDSLQVLEFYVQGNLKKSYLLGEILCSVYSITSATGFFFWYVRDEFSNEQRTFSFTTLELNRFVFDLTSGDIISKTLHPAITKQSLMIYGQIEKTGKYKYEMEVWHRVYGKIPSIGKVQFFCKQLHNIYAPNTVLVNNGTCTHLEFDISNWMFNNTVYIVERDLPKEKFEQEYPYNKEDCL